MRPPTSTGDRPTRTGVPPSQAGSWRRARRDRGAASPAVVRSPRLVPADSPVHRLADAARRLMSGRSGVVGVVRRFDRRDRELGGVLRDALREHGLSVADLAAVPDASSRHLLAAETDIRLVVPASALSRDDAHRVAARLKVPVVSPDLDAPPAEVVELRRDGRLVDVALSRVQVRPEQQDTSRLDLTVDRRTLHLPAGTRVDVTLHGGMLRVTTGSGRAAAAREVRVVPAWGLSTLLRDGVPCADLREPLVLSVGERLDVHPVGRT